MEEARKEKEARNGVFGSNDGDRGGSRGRRQAQGEGQRGSDMIFEEWSENC